MARSTSIFAVCLVLFAVAACAGPRGNSCGAPACAASCDPCSSEPTPPPCDRPPEAKAGEAWCRVWVPPVHEQVSDTVMCSPATTRKVRVPAKYGYRPKLVCVSPAKMKDVVRPAVWTTKTEDVCVRGPREVFRRVDCDPNNKCGPKQECWVKQDCPPVFKSQSRPVCIEPPRREIKWRPAKYEMRNERFIAKEASCLTQCVPATYKERIRTVCVSPGRWEWRRNENCEVPVPEPIPGLPALEVEMVDSDPQGAEKGVFKSGSVVRYNLKIRSDEGSEAVPNIRVIFTLPVHLEFISGAGMGVVVNGSGQRAESATFQVKLTEEVNMHILARVVSVPPTNHVQTTASIQTAAGEELASETESTTLTGTGK
jgi:hypothetical protein